MRKIQSLNGWWDYRIGKGEFVKKIVPYSDLCVGLSECVLNFDAEYKRDRAYLVFEGITYLACVTLNGVFLGEIAPYIEHKLEITDVLKETGNSLSVEIRDTGMPFGPSAGWENYSGIIRNVYIEYTEKSVISDVVWHFNLTDDYSGAECFAEAEIDTDKDVRFCVVLKDSNGNIAGEGESGADGKVKFNITKPELWSPDRPYLYTIECSLFEDGNIVDFVSQKVGFKDFCIKGKKFYLNGEPLFILGVNKHDLFGEKGHTYSEDEMRKDMRMIKDAGCNYVRLVHYPHNKKIIEIADEIGLMVSEEPGLWWSDMKNKETCDGALRVLEGTIKRDRNHISIAFWLSFNECKFTLEFLEDSARLARKTDPYHMVSGANCMDLEMTKENFLKCGFDFYTMHPYAPTVDRIIESVEALTEMPLLFTEWGGYYCDRNERLFREFIQTIVKISKNTGEDKPTLAGAVFWEWAETYDFNRGEPACVDGILHEGLVDMYRNPTSNLHIFTEEFSKLHLTDTADKYKIAVTDFNAEQGEYLPVSLDNIPYPDNAWEEMIKDSKRPIKDYELRSVRKTEKGPMLPESVLNIGNISVKLDEKPLVLSEKEIVIPVNEIVDEICVVGNTSMPVGFPIESEYGEEVAEYSVEYADGSCAEYKMLNGEDITTATLLHGSSRINPVAANSPRVITFSYNRDWEQYIVNLRCIKTDKNKEIKNLRLRSLNKNYYPLLYGISIKK